MDEINNQTTDTVVTVRKAEDIVDKQDNIMNETIRTFHDMNCDVEKLINNLN